MPADDKLPEEVEEMLALGDLDGPILFLFSRPTFLTNRFFDVFRRRGAKGGSSTAQGKPRRDS